MGGVAGEWRERAIGQCQHRHSALRGGFDRVDGRGGVRRLTDGDQQITGVERVDLVVNRPAEPVEQHAIAGDQVVRISKLKGDAEARPHAEETDSLRGGNRAHGSLEALRRVQSQHGFQIHTLRGGNVARQSVDAIDRMLDVNLRGTLLLTREVIRGMMIRQKGWIINISSIVGLSGYKGTVTYSATKGAVDAMTRALARELGPRNIIVNSIAPGYLQTDLTASMNPKQLDQVIRRTPLGRLGRVEDVIGLVLFLISPEASFISGQTIVVDGGLTA